MRLYRRSKHVDLTDSIALCDFDADHGRVKLALDRLHDLEKEVGADAKISYAEGLLRQDFLGQGLLAYKCFVRAQELDPEHRLAACNAAQCAPTEAESRKWARVATGLSGLGEQKWRSDVVLMDAGLTYQQLLIERGAAQFESKNYGRSAAYVEMALQAGSLEENEESQRRRNRAQSLRALDLEAARLREAAAERFPPEERLSLQEGVLELERAVVVDGYDAELWNLLSAWYVVLERNNEAVAAADKSIGLRPSGYPKPYHNKARALWNGNRNDEALAAATLARQEAQNGGTPEDLRLAEGLVSDIQRGHHDCSEELVLYMGQKILTGAGVRTNQFAGLIDSTAEDLGKLFEARLRSARPGTSLDHVSAIAQLLAYYPAEAATTVLQNLWRDEPQTWSRCFDALCYIIVNAEPVMQRDAARVACLLSLTPLTLERIRTVCREGFLAPALAVPATFAALAEHVRAELDRLNHCFPRMLLDHSQPSEQELRKAREGIAVRLRGTPFINDAANFKPDDATVSGDPIVQTSPDFQKFERAGRLTGRVFAFALIIWVIWTVIRRWLR